MASKLLKSPKQLNDHIERIIGEIDDYAPDTAENSELLANIKSALLASQRHIEAKVPLKMMNEHVDQLTKLARYYSQSQEDRRRDKDPTPGFNRYVAKLSTVSVGKHLQVGLKKIAALFMRREKRGEYIADAKQLASNRKQFAGEAKLFKASMSKTKKTHKDIRKGAIKQLKRV